MAGVSSEPFKEHATVIDALKASYSGPEDVAAIAEVQRIEKQMRDLIADRTLRMEDTIRMLTQKVEESKAELASAPEDEAAHERRVSDMQQSMRSSQENIEKLSKENRFLQQQCRRLMAEAEVIEERQRELLDFERITDPRTRSIVSLYMHITNVSWDESSDLAQWKGVLASSKDGPIRRIHIDRSQTSEFDAINKVWEMIGT